MGNIIVFNIMLFSVIMCSFIVSLIIIVLGGYVQQQKFKILGYVH